MATVNLTADLTRDATATPDNRPWFVWAAEYQEGDGGLITPKRSDPIRPVAGVLTIPVEAGIVAVIENPDGRRYPITAPMADSALWNVIEAAIAFPPETSAERLASVVEQYLVDNPPAAGWSAVTGKPDFFKQAARNPDSLIAGSITRDANGAATSAPVVWPDGSPGTYTALTLSTLFPGAVDSYKITYGSPVTATYTQPAVTRDATGAATAVPSIVVS